MKVYRCSGCGFICEVAEWPTRCERCRCENELVPLTEDMVVALIDLGEIAYCPACKRVQSGPLDMLNGRTPEDLVVGHRGAVAKAHSQPRRRR